MVDEEPIGDLFYKKALRLQVVYFSWKKRKSG
jgi:hypothetical protein